MIPVILLFSHFAQDTLTSLIDGFPEDMSAVEPLDRFRTRKPPMKCSQARVLGSYLSNLGLIRAALSNLKTKGYNRVYDFRDRNEFLESSGIRDPIDEIIHIKLSKALYIHELELAYQARRLLKETNVDPNESWKWNREQSSICFATFRFLAQNRQVLYQNQVRDHIRQTLIHPKKIVVV